MSKVEFTRDGDVGIITLDDPPLDLVSPELVDGLEGAIESAESAASGCRSRPSPRCRARGRPSGAEVLEIARRSLA